MQHLLANHRLLVLVAEGSSDFFGYGMSICVRFFPAVVESVLTQPTRALLGPEYESVNLTLTAGGSTWANACHAKHFLQGCGGLDYRVFALRVIISGFISEYLYESGYLGGESAERKRSRCPNLRIEH